MNRKDDASEVASELSSELSSYERGDADILEEEVLEDENNFLIMKMRGYLRVPHQKIGEAQEAVRRK